MYKTAQKQAFFTNKVLKTKNRGKMFGKKETSNTAPSVFLM